MKKTGILITAIFVYLLGMTTLLFIKQKKQEEIAQERYQAITIGAPDAGQGESLYSAFTKVNSNFDAHDDSIAGLRTHIGNLKAGALPLSQYAFMMYDSNNYGGAITRNGMINYIVSQGLGGSSAGGYEWVNFIVGTTQGAPATATATFTVPEMAGDAIELYRGTDENLALQWLNKGDTNTVTGYRYNSAGKVTVRPAWSTGERAYVRSVPSIAVVEDALAGGTPTSTLLTGLRAGWLMNESSGTQANEVTGTYTGTTNATVNQPGKFGTSYSYASASSQITTCGIDVGDLGTSDFTYSVWIYVPTLQSAYNGIFEIQGNASAYVCLDEDNVVRAVFSHDGTTYKHNTSNSAITASTWMNIIVSYDRNGLSRLYINGVLQNDTEDVSAGVAVDIQTALPLRIGRGGSSTWYFNGRIDDVFLWTRLLTQDEIDDIQTKPYPW